MSTPKTIILRGDPIRKAALAGGSITPGMLLAWSSGTLVAHAAAGGNAQKMFAVEEDYIGSDINTVYTSTNGVQYVVAHPGDEIYAFLATGNNVVKGDALESNGAGALQKHTAPAIVETGSSTITVYTDGIVAFAAEDYNNTSGSNGRLRVEVA